MRLFRSRWTGGPAPLSIEDYRRLARRTLPEMVWAYIEGGADDLVTVRANRSAFSRWAFSPRVLTGSRNPHLRTEACGLTFELPVFLAPVGMLAVGHWTGEIGAATAAEHVGTRLVVSAASSYTLEEVAKATRCNHMFQLYPSPIDGDRARAATDSLIERAVHADYAALFVTVDSPMRGNREWERRTEMRLTSFTPARLAREASRPGWWFSFFRHRRAMPRQRQVDTAESTKPAAADTSSDAAFDWDALGRLRDKWGKTLLVKGILHPDDAERAVALGVDGVVVSNHGGRQLDSAQASIDALPAVVARVDGRVPVLLDGGIRRGTDVVKAMCLGAAAVGIGRPYLYGLAARGPAGVGHVLEILREEISRTLTLLGCADVSDLNETYLKRSDGDEGPGL